MAVKSELEVHLPFGTLKPRTLPLGREYKCINDRASELMCGLRVVDANTRGVYKRDHANDFLNAYLKRCGDDYRLGTIARDERNSISIRNSVCIEVSHIVQVNQSLLENLLGYQIS